MNLPNKLSLIRICLIPVFVVFFFLTALPYNYVYAAVVFAVAAVTDFLDGRIARKRGMVTNLGKFLDPIADKVLVATAFVLMLTKYEIFGLFGHDFYVAGAVCVCLILARELIISAFRQIAAANGVVLAADMLGKLKTNAQDYCVVALIASASFAGTAQQVISVIGLVLFAAAVILTVISGVSYIVKNPAVLKTEK
jgi:CDP-diacylglycerol--glycerol-3-phosphate 3-phosphatidyltransferase